MSQAILLLPHIKVQNANCISSPLTWGFPSLTAVFGFVHALERKMKLKHPDIRFLQFGIACHAFDPQTQKSYQHTFKLMRKPLTKEGNTAAIVEEGRAHLTISIVIKAEGTSLNISDIEREPFMAEMMGFAHTLRFAGGSLLPTTNYKKSNPEFFVWQNDIDVQKKEFIKIRRKLLPGFVLLSREILLTEHMENFQQQQPNKNLLDALLSFSSVAYSCKKNEEKLEWSIEKKLGWLVPISIGYQAISECYPAGTINDARDEVTEFQFVENIYSLGEWKSPHRIQSLDELLWRDEVDIKNGIYRCINKLTN